MDQGAKLCVGACNDVDERHEPEWFHIERVHDWLYLIREVFFFIGNRCNIWLIKAEMHDVLIDTGLGVRDLKEFLQHSKLIDVDSRPCIVICTHCHFDHVGGAHHFTADNVVYVHERDAPGVEAGRQTATLNYVKPDHFIRIPYAGFSASHYRVPPTPCHRLHSGEVIDIGNDRLEILHVPGHSAGSIAVYYAAKRALFSGDFVYECGDGGALIDWLPTSDVGDYVRSSNVMLEWLGSHPDVTLYPGHFDVLNAPRTVELLNEYRGSKNSCTSTCCTGCMQYVTGVFFCCGCFRCCPC